LCSHSNPATGRSEDNPLFRTFPTRRSSDLRLRSAGFRAEVTVPTSSPGDPATTRNPQSVCPRQSRTNRVHIVNQLPTCNSCHRRSEEHTSELQSRENLVCRLLLEKKNQTKN